MQDVGFISEADNLGSFVSVNAVQTAWMRGCYIEMIAK